MTNYKMQYWLYAILNKLHGSEVKMERDPLHGRYSVNRHGFTVSSNTTPVRRVRDNLIANLTAAGYTEVLGHSSVPDNIMVTKVFGKERRFVTINFQKYMDSPKVTLAVQGSVYRDR